MRARGSSLGGSGGFVTGHVKLTLKFDGQALVGLCLTFNSVTKGQTIVAWAQSILQHHLLELDDGLQHPQVLDLRGGDDDTAIHEVGNGVGQILFGLRQESLQTEHLKGSKVENVNSCYFLLLCPLFSRPD